VDAEPLFKRSLSIREKVLGRGHPDVARSLIRAQAAELANCASHKKYSNDLKGDRGGWSR
jgi:hypothetical protein